jgi:hypothetical protein
MKTEMITGLVRRAAADHWCRPVMDLTLIPMQAVSAAASEGEDGAKAGVFRSRL